MPKKGHDSKKKRRRHKRGGPAYALLSFVLIVAAVALALSVFFKITHIEVEGAQVCRESDVIRASGIQEGDNLFFLSKSDAIRGIFEQFPYVKQVRILRKLPDILVLDITERKALGYVEQGGSYWLVDGTGLLLEKSVTRPEFDVPRVLGLSLINPTAGSPAVTPQEDQDRLTVLLALLGGLENQELLAGVSDVDVTKPHELKMEYDGRFTVLLGSSLDLEVKLPFFAETIKRLPSSARGTVDVSRAVQKKASYLPELVEETPAETQSPDVSPAEADATPEE